MVQSLPFIECRLKVEPAWIDYNGHMNVGYYGVAFDKATDALLDHIGAGEAYRFEHGASTFVAEAHATFDQEVAEADPLRFETIVLDADEKRLHIFHAMYHDTRDYLAATTELMILHVDLGERRVTPFPAGVASRISELLEAHRNLERPVQVGRRIGMRR